MIEQTEWIVITGRPYSGISSVCDCLKDLVIPEAARSLIDERIAKGETIKQIRTDEAKFQRQVLKRKVKVENALSRNKKYILDRTVIDSVAYFLNCLLDPQEALAACQKVRYKIVFYLLPLPSFSRDYARTESLEEAERLEKLIRWVYELLGYKVIEVPVMSVEDRAKFIKSHIEQNQKGGD